MAGLEYPFPNPAANGPSATANAAIICKYPKLKKKCKDIYVICFVCVSDDGLPNGRQEISNFR